MPAKPKLPVPAARNRAPKKEGAPAAASSPTWRAAFLAALAVQGNVSAAAQAAKVGRRTVYDLRAADPAFAAAWDKALEEGADALEAEARRRAFAGSDTLLIFLLKGARPERYRENIKARVEHSGEIKGAVRAITDEENARLRGARRAYLQEMNQNPLLAETLALNGNDHATGLAVRVP